jgi:hypothetical protein
MKDIDILKKGSRINQEIIYMFIDKTMPDVYENHALLNEAISPFAEIPGYLVISEPTDSLDWNFVLWREDGELVALTLTGLARNELRLQLVRVIRDILGAMLAA